MSTHEITVADCTWAEVTFSDTYEARAHLKEIIADRLELQRMIRDLKMTPSVKTRYKAAVSELKRREAELHDLLLDCAFDDMFDL